jgi:hypothetical protein
MPSIYRRIHFNALKCIIVGVSINLLISLTLKRISGQMHIKYPKLSTKLLNVVDFIFSPLSFFLMTSLLHTQSKYLLLRNPLS